MLHLHCVDFVDMVTYELTSKRWKCMNHSDKYDETQEQEYLLHEEEILAIQEEYRAHGRSELT